MNNSREKHNAHVINLPKWPVYCFITHRNENIIVRWLEDERVPKAQIATLQAKIDAYEQGGPDLNPGFISGPVAKDIYKIKIKGHKGHVQLRPMVCYGPHDPDEVTLLSGAIEKDFKLIPDTCKVDAQENRRIVLANRGRRRRERIDGTITT